LSYFLNLSSHVLFVRTVSSTSSKLHTTIQIKSGDKSTYPYLKTSKDKFHGTRPNLSNFSTGNVQHVRKMKALIKGIPTYNTQKIRVEETHSLEEIISAP
jgi:hypothetical protein